MINNIVVEGRLVKEVEFRIVTGDKMVSKGTIACNDFRKETPDYIRFETWGPNAKYLAENTNKGTRLILNGKLRTKKYKDKDDQWREDIYVEVHEISNVTPGNKLDNAEIDSEALQAFNDGDNPFTEGTES